MSRNKNIEIDPSKRVGITREDLILLEDKVLSQIEVNENKQIASNVALNNRILGDQEAE